MSNLNEIVAEQGHCYHKNTVDTQAPYPYCDHDDGWDYCAASAKFCNDCNKTLYETESGKWLTEQGWLKAEHDTHLSSKHYEVPNHPRQAISNRLEGE